MNYLMKVVCIDNNTYKHPLKDGYIIIGKEYECINEKDGYYLIRFNDFFNWWITKELFMTIEEYRNKKLEEIGI